MTANDQIDVYISPTGANKPIISVRRFLQDKMIVDESGLPLSVGQQYRLQINNLLLSIHAPKHMDKEEIMAYLAEALDILEELPF